MTKILDKCDQQKTKNEQLLCVTKQWLENDEVKDWIERAGDQRISNWLKKNLGTNEYFLSEPFIMGIPEYTDKNKKLIMVVGQETDLWGNMKNIYPNGDFNITNMTRLQNWVVQAMAYINGIENNPKWQNYDGVNDVPVNVRNSPFFNFLKALAKHFNVCWNNLDKIHYTAIINDVSVEDDIKNATQSTPKHKVVTLYPKDETLLGKKIFGDKSLLQKEMEIVKPNIVLFLTGPNYKHSMEQSVGRIFEEDPSINKKVIKCETKDKTIYLWTYHPGYLQRKSAYDEVLNNISNSLNVNIEQQD